MKSEAKLVVILLTIGVFLLLIANINSALQNWRLEKENKRLQEKIDLLIKVRREPFDR